MSGQAALRGAIVAGLAADPALLALLGGPRIHDGAPRGCPHPFVELGAVETRLLAAERGEGERHAVDIHVLSRRPARGEVAAILDAIEAALPMLASHLSGHRLIHIADPVSRSERLRDGRTWRGRLSVRIVTEPLA